MHISEQPEAGRGRHDAGARDEIPVPAPVRSVAHVGESGEWNPLVPARSDWTPRGRRATHRATGRH